MSVFRLLGNGQDWGLWAYKVSKRIFDLAFSIILITLTAPFMALALVIIKTSDSRGPVIFRQERIGRHGEPFIMFKFRTMYVRTPEEEGSLDLVETHDPRIIPGGKFLRRFRMDELPQLWNVLRGEMSLVGPRSRPRSVDDIWAAIDQRYLSRYAVKPGVTGFQQVMLGRAETIEAKRQAVNYDLRHVENTSLRTDLWVFLKTIPVVISAKGI